VVDNGHFVLLFQLVNFVSRQKKPFEFYTLGGNFTEFYKTTLNRVISTTYYTGMRVWMGVILQCNLTLFRVSICKGFQRKSLWIAS